jgi:hypothetical protein
VPLFETELAEADKQIDAERQRLMEMLIKEESGDIEETDI